MAKQQTEEELDIKRKARRRLVGAIALALAVVVILPMVLDREPKSGSHDINLSIPDPDKTGVFVPGVPVKEVVQSHAQSASSVEELQQPLTASAVPAVAHAGEPVDVSKSKPAEPEKVVPVASKPQENKPVSADGFVAQIGAYTNANTAKHELDKLKKWGFRAYTEKAGDKVRVRVGPYQEREKAEKAGELLKKHGLHPVVLSIKD